jgi:RNA recognition motif-containing protein
MYRIFIRKLPPNCRTKDLQAYIESQPIGDYTLRKKKNKGKNKKSPIELQVYDREDYELFLFREHLINGVPVNFEQFFSPEEQRSLKNQILAKRVFISNLPLGITAQDLWGLFEKFGQLNNVFIKPSTSQADKKNAKGKQYSSVTFENESDAQQCGNLRQLRYRGKVINVFLKKEYEHISSKVNKKKKLIEINGRGTKGERRNFQKYRKYEQIYSDDEVKRNKGLRKGREQHSNIDQKQRTFRRIHKNYGTGHFLRMRPRFAENSAFVKLKSTVDRRDWYGARITEVFKICKIVRKEIFDPETSENYNDSGGIVGYNHRSENIRLNRVEK